MYQSVVTYLCYDYLHLFAVGAVHCLPAQHVWRTSAFATTKGDKGGNAAFI